MKRLFALEAKNRLIKTQRERRRGPQEIPNTTIVRTTKKEDDTFRGELLAQQEIGGT